MNYEQGLDTLFVKELNGKGNFAFANSSRHVFLRNDWFVTQHKQELTLLHLPTGKRRLLEGVTYFEVVADHTKLLLHFGEGEKRLELLQPSHKPDWTITGVHEFKTSPNLEKLVLSLRSADCWQVVLKNLEKPVDQKVLFVSEGQPHGFEWSTGAEAVAFFVNREQFTKDDNTVVYCNLTNRKTKVCDPRATNLPSGGKVVPFGSYRLTIADDLSRVFFAVNFRDDINEEKNDVQVWNGNAKWIYPQLEKHNQYNSARMGMWDVRTDEFKMISDDALPWVTLAGKGIYALGANLASNGPDYHEFGIVDLYLTDLENGVKSLLLKDHSAYPHATRISPEENYIVYFRDSDWWAYDLSTKQHRNYTSLLNVSFVAEESDRPGKRAPYGLVGFTENDYSMLVYDRFDLWEIEMKTAKAKRLTKGRENNLRFRIVSDLNAGSAQPIYDGLKSTVVPLKKGLVLKGTDGDTECIISRSPNGIPQEIYRSKNRIDQITKVGMDVAFRQQRHDCPPQVVVVTQGQCKEIYQSNPSYLSLDSGKAELVSFTNKKGKLLKGILYYPAKYDPMVKYPMIVHVYERQSPDFNVYAYPKKRSSEGFNVKDFTMKGYFVFLPDIAFEIGNTGISAEDCVTSGVTAVLTKGIVLKDKIGLIGHSFGGYLTDFIITHTDIFAAAVAGSAVTDLPGYYFDVNWDYGLPQTWRIENQQWRMGEPYFGNMDG